MCLCTQACMLSDLQLQPEYLRSVCASCAHGHQPCWRACSSRRRQARSRTSMAPRICQSRCCPLASGCPPSAWCTCQTLRPTPSGCSCWSGRQHPMPRCSHAYCLLYMVPPCSSPAKRHLPPLPAAIPRASDVASHLAYLCCAVQVEDAKVPLASFELTGLDEIKAKYNDTSKISTHFKCVLHHEQHLTSAMRHCNSGASCGT